MKHVLCLGLVALATSTASAAVIAEEPFPYAEGDSLTGKTASGFTWGSTATGAADDLVFNATSLSPTTPYTLPTAFPPPSGAKARIGGSGRTYVPIGSKTSGTFYYSMLVDVHSLNNSSTTAAILSGFASASDGGANPTGVTATLFGRPGTVADTYQLGVARNSNAANASFGSDIALGAAVFVVASVEIVAGTSNDVARLWINPDPDTFGDETEPTAMVTGLNTGSDSSINSFVLYQRGTNNGLSVLGSWVDELKIGTTWADVTPVPEPASIGFACVGTMLLCRRRRTYI